MVNQAPDEFGKWRDIRLDHGHETACDENALSLCEEVFHIGNVVEHVDHIDRRDGSVLKWKFFGRANFLNEGQRKHIRGYQIRNKFLEKSSATTQLNAQPERGGLVDLCELPIPINVGKVEGALALGKLAPADRCLDAIEIQPAGSWFLEQSHQPF